ncbi:hypothetical protein LSH36_266g02042 [Paralvinella palmiformis]|uniref:HAUS augmin-like complex subunit 3 N-terminal domain-containing protein n=1 Tax=Paralvinella palmiformis TaxID=53620 RepID=A0AAD9JK54_9ANNE|nr:hypothetical protein LSH36_266g02042 [Paralvinella palmiformis]
MSGKKFVEALSRLGYPGASELDGDSFDWIFEFDPVLPFLDWFCEGVQANNRLDPKDIEEFIALEQSDEGILEGEQLDEALQCFTKNEEEMTEDQLRQEIEQLENDLQKYQLRRDLLMQQRKSLSEHKTDMGNRLSKLQHLESAAKAQCMLQLDKSSVANAKMNAALNNVVLGASELNKLYQESKPELDDVMSEANTPIFFSQIGLEDFFKMEEKFTTELTAFTKKRFFEGIAEMAGAGEGSRYPKNEALRVNALVEEKTTKITCDFTEMKIQQLKEKPYPMDSTGLSNHLKDAQITLAVLRQHLMALGEDEIPSLIKDSAKLQVACILRGNYDLKIARQNYFMDNQEQIIEQLLIQKARYEFLTMGFELESRAHRNTCRLLKAVKTLLQDAARLQKERMRMLKDPLLSSNLNERSTLDSRDKFFSRLHQLLDEGECTNQPQLFITYQQLVSNSEKLNNHLAFLRSSSSTANNSQEDRIRMLEKSLVSCEASLYSGSNTLSSKPRLSPEPVIDLILQLDGMLKRLESSMLDIVKDVEQKKKSLRRDTLLLTERELFVYFFNDPDRLRRVINDVSNRLESHLVK